MPVVYLIRVTSFQKVFLVSEGCVSLDWLSSLLSLPLTEGCDDGFFFWSERRSNKVSYITRSIRLCVSNLIWRVSCIASGIPILIHTIPLIFSEWPHYHINVSCPTICPYTPIIKLENKVFSVSKSCFTKTNGKQRDITKPRQINVLFHEI